MTIEDLEHAIWVAQATGRLRIELAALSAAMPPGEWYDRLGTILVNFDVVCDMTTSWRVRDRIMSQETW